MIVRIMGEGQYRLETDAAGDLNQLDGEAGAAVEAGDEARLGELLDRMAALVRSRGQRLDDADLSPSDAMVPPPDLSLDEARALFEGEGLIPDLPT
jgi:hypothetical protein